MILWKSAFLKINEKMIFLFLLLSFQIINTATIDKLLSGELIEKFVTKNSRYVSNFIGENPNIQLYKFDDHLSAEEKNNIKDIFDIIHEKKEQLCTANKECNYEFNFTNQDRPVSAYSKYCNFKNTNRNEGFWTSIITGSSFVYAKGIHEECNEIEKTDKFYRNYLKQNGIPYFILNSCDPFFINSLNYNITNLCLANIHEPIRYITLEKFLHLETLSVYKAYIDCENGNFISFSSKLKKLTFDSVQENSQNNKLVLLDLDNNQNLETLKIQNSYVEINNKKPLEKLQKLEISENNTQSIFDFHQDSLTNLKKLTWHQNKISDENIGNLLFALRKDVIGASLKASNFSSIFNNFSPFQKLTKLILKNTEKETVNINAMLFQDLDHLELENVRILNHDMSHYKKLHYLSLKNTIFPNDSILNLALLQKCKDISIMGKTLQFLQYDNETILSFNQNSKNNSKYDSLDIVQNDNKITYILNIEPETHIEQMFIHEHNNIDTITIKIENHKETTIPSLKVKNIRKLKIEGNINKLDCCQNIENLTIKNNKEKMYINDQDNNIKTLSIKDKNTLSSINLSIFKQLEYLTIPHKSLQIFFVYNTMENLKTLLNLKNIKIGAQININKDKDEIKIFGKSIFIPDEVEKILKFYELFLSDNNTDTIKITDIKNIFLHCKHIERQEQCKEQCAFWQAIINHQNDENNKIECLTITHIPRGELDQIKQIVEENLKNPNFKIVYEEEKIKTNNDIIIEPINNIIDEKITKKLPEIITKNNNFLKKYFPLILIIIAGSLGYHFRKLISKKFISTSI